MGSAPGNDARLRADQASFRLLVLVFVRDYHARLGEGPSYGEIAAHFDCSRSRVKKAVQRLVAEGRLERGPGPRSLAPPSARDDAIAALERLGFTVDRDGKSLAPPAGDGAGEHGADTKRPLRRAPDLRYP